VAALDLVAAQQQLAAARGRMLAGHVEDSEAKEQWSVALGQWVSALAAGILLKTGNKIKPADFGLAASRMEVAQAAAGRAEEAWKNSREKSKSFESAAALRLTLDLSLLESDEIVARVAAGAALRAEARALYPSAVFLAGRVVPELCKLFLAHEVVVKLIQRLQNSSKKSDEALINACLRASGQLHDQLQHIHGKLGNTALYPFEHAQERISLGHFALPSLPADPKALDEVMLACEEAMDKLATTYHRVVGRLAVAALEVEKALGLEPLTEHST
jgi:hypothetical protein